MKRFGKHGLFNDWKAVGRRCTKAVAIRTPVPKCLQKKNTFGGIFNDLNFFATTGKPAPKIEALKTRTVDDQLWVHRMGVGVTDTKR